MQFTKMHGLGNDFVMIDGKNLSETENLEDLAVKICDRHFGVGADGMIIILPSETADARMRIFNADGSEPEMCGNGIRCFAQYVYEQGIVSKQQIRVETLAGIIVPHLQIETGRIEGIQVDMGEPRLERSQIPMLGEKGQVVNETIPVGNSSFQVTAVSMGNPHCVIYLDNVNQIELKDLGPQIEKHYLFPKKANVEFVEVLSTSEVKMRVWERGAGETMACGTGACAVGVAGVLNGVNDRKVTVHLEGGDLGIFWSQEDNHVYMTGPAETAFTGEIEIS